MNSFNAALLAGVILLFVSNLSGQGGVYLSGADAPRPSKTPSGINLRNSSGSEGAFNVRVSLAEMRVESDSSKGGAGMTGRLNVFRKFFRVEIAGATRLSQPASLSVKYAIQEGEGISTAEETVSIDAQGANLIIDTGGFEDKYGTEVKSKTSGSKVTSTKYKHFEAEIVAAHITITDKAGAELYVGGWPEAESRPANLPEHLKVRAYTSIDGRQLNAIVSAVDKESVIFLINGRPFKVDLSKLTAPDREFLEKVRMQSQ